MDNKSSFKLVIFSNSGVCIKDIAHLLGASNDFSVDLFEGDPTLVKIEKINKVEIGERDE